MRGNLIRARIIPNDALTDEVVAPFLAAYGRLPPAQIPALAPAVGSRQPLAILFLDGSERIGYALVQRRHSILAEVFHGPVVLSADQYLACVAALKPLLRRRGLLLLRVLPPYSFPRPDGLEGRFNWATCVVDISLDADKLLQSFAPNHRQSIRKGLDAPLSIMDMEYGTEEAFAEGYVAMFARRTIDVPARATIRLLQTLPKHDHSFVLCARHVPDGALVGGCIFLISGDTCTYFQGWSARTGYPVLHTLLWRAMLHAKERGCTRFDLGGYSLDETNGQLKSINDFKRWFRGTVLYYPSTAIIPLYRPVQLLLRCLSTHL